MAPLLLLLFGLLGQWLLGLAAARWLLLGSPIRSTDQPDKCSLAEQTGLGIVLGIGLTAWFLFVWSQAGGMLGHISSLVLCGIGYVSGSLALFRWITRGRRKQIAVAGIKVQQSRPTAFCRLCQCWISFWFAMAIVQSLMTPQRFWDERAIFAMKSAVLFEDRSVYSRDLAERDFVQGHPCYPLLLPLAEQHLYALLGTVDDRLSKVIFPLLYAGLTLTMIGVLSRHTLPSQAWMYGTLLATVPALMPDEYGFLSGQADAPVACFHGVAAFYIWDVLERIRADGKMTRNTLGAVVVAGICGGLAAFTKDEGIAFLIVDAAVMTLFVCVGIWQGMQRIRQTEVKTSGNSAADNETGAQTKGFPGSLTNSVTRGSTVIPLVIVLVIFVGLAAMLIIPWRIHRRGLPADAEMNYFGRMSLSMLAGRLTTLTWTIPHLFRRMFWEWREWGLQWWVMIAALILIPRRSCKYSQMFLLLDVLGALMALVVAGMLAPIRLEEHIGGSSHRFLMQISPVAVLFIAGQFAPREQRGGALAAGPLLGSRP